MAKGINNSKRQKKTPLRLQAYLISDISTVQSAGSAILKRQHQVTQNKLKIKKI